MRLFVFVLLLTTVSSAVAKAAPYAEYDPRTGDITIRGLSGSTAPAERFNAMLLGSLSGKLNPLILSAPTEVMPMNSAPPRLTTKLTEWLNVQPTTIWFEFTSIKIPGAFLPGTPIEDVYYKDSYRSTTIRQGAVVEVPEPGSIALLITAVAGAIALRRHG